MWRGTKVLVSLFLAVGLTLLVWRYLDVEQLIATLKRTSLGWFAASVALFFLYQWFRALRFRLLVDVEGGRGALFITLCAHALFNSILPAGLGELAFVWLLRRLHNLRYAEGAASLIVARFVDLSVFTALFVAVVVIFGDELPMALSLFTMGMVLSLVIGFFILREGVRRALAAKLDNNSWMNRFAVPVALAMKVIHSRGAYLPLAGYSMLMWVCMYLYFLTTVWALGYFISATQMLMFYLMLFPIRLMPIKGVANFGTHEAGWFIALVLLEVPSSQAATLAFGSHILFLAGLFIVALLPLGSLTLVALKERRMA